MGLILSNKNGLAGRVRFYSTPSGGIEPSVSLLLDQYPGAAAAYSLRKLRSDYTGAAIRVRRSSDNTEQDIGFVNNGLDESSLTSFVGAGNGFIVRWYDQGLNDNTLLQTVTANQPSIVSSGNVITESGKLCIQFDGSNDEMSFTKLIKTSTYYDFWVLRTIDTDFIPLTAVSGNKFSWVGQSGGAGALYSEFGSPQLYKNSILSTPTSRNSVYQAFNGYNLIHTSNANTTTWASDFKLSGYGSPYKMSMNLQEIIIYDTDQSSNRTGIESNINDFYNIY